MEQIKELLKENLEEIDRLLQSKTVVGEAIQAGDQTVIPLLSVGFGFGAGGCKGSKGNGDGGGSGAGGGIKPIAVILIKKDGTSRVQAISGGLGEALGKIASSVCDSLSKESKEKKLKDTD